MKIEGCTALVTGGNRGIGQGFVEELLEAGAEKIYVAARTLADAEAAAAANPRLVGIELDVTKPDQVAAAAAQATDVDLLINNAGAFVNTTLLGAPDDGAMRQEIETNYLGPVAMIRAFAPILKANGGGAVVNVLSAGGIVAVPNMGGYSPSKFAMRAASDCLRAELAPQGTTVHALIVGSVDTRMAAHVTWQEKSSPRTIGKAGLTAVTHNIDEHDTDPHSVSVRAFLARDPATLKKAMAAALNRVAK
ncbi:SDR family oxidoreductase [Glacieibacterium frigidum]|uniref:SDR family NAD(P)-dependent oxidoreductase n=1 Tax=Glacieibacterium frigidum TaxID=2593303 RepID=A0A552U760_9SPHN|nr:SDR family oxidoreductase [Glacieibacterium frigidum]TRW14056.1 SDR family NAD(P)-dependent oxidoreductase [Glacieibacterium frigidum]